GGGIEAGGREEGGTESGGPSRTGGGGPDGGLDLIPGGPPAGSGVGVWVAVGALRPIVVSRKCRKSVCRIDMQGTAKRAPLIWKKCSPTSSEKTTRTGWIFAESPMIFGLRKFASSWWMPMIQTSTANAVPNDWVRPI